MEQIEDFSDKRLKYSCIYCNKGISFVESNRDHVPSKSLLKKPYPSNLPTIEVCSGCNSSFSVDEEYLAAFLGAVIAGTIDLDAKHFPRAHRILKANANLRSRIEHARLEQTSGGQKQIIWEPEHPRVKNVVLKNARGHAYHELGEPMPDKPRNFRVGPLESLTDSEREEFENADMGPYWSEVGSRMMTRRVTGQDLENDWVIVQDVCYRYAVIQQGAITVVRMVIAEYLAVEVVWEDYLDAMDWDSYMQLRSSPRCPKTPSSQLQEFLNSALMKESDAFHSPLWRHTWKVLFTSSGQPIPVHVALPRHGTSNILSSLPTIWQTPTSSATKGFAGTPKKPRGPSAKKKSGSLNPEFVCWLMGFPKEWNDCAPKILKTRKKPDHVRCDSVASKQTLHPKKRQ
ncbi:MAG: hypothetical protein OXF05_03395 [Hyphomicrobiales bacterium]|nr:hypothetical protein [Hyphomicrobiales bacterium]